MIWTIFYWALLVCSIGVGLWALLWDRAGFRGRASLRCKKCWYDLTASPGDLAEGPIVCPECGKGHKSRRMMRKTRRSKKWVAVALVLAMASHSVRVTPNVKKRGWWAAVPSWVLIGSIHQVPRFVKDPNTQWQAITYGRSSPFQRAMLDLSIRNRAGELGWFDYQLAAWLARTEGEAGLCANAGDRSQGAYARASVYRVLIEHGIAREKLGDYHEKWYRRLVHVSISSRPKWPEGARVYARVHINYAYSWRAYGNRFIPPLKIRVRLERGEGEYLFEQNGKPAFPFGSYRTLATQDWPGSISVLGNSSIWNDGQISVSVSEREGNVAKVVATITESTGYSGVPENYESFVSQQEASCQIERVADIASLANVIEDESVIDEIERCVEASGLYWYDIDGRRHTMLQLKLVEQPNLGRRRYTFGGSTSSRSENTDLRGNAWWALNPKVDGSWELIHGGEYVPMYGWFSDQEQESEYPDRKNVLIRSKPMFCLRDEEATTLLEGWIRFKGEWKPADRSW